MFRQLRPRTVKKFNPASDLHPRERQTRLFFEKGRENRQRLLEKLRGFSLEERAVSAHEKSNLSVKDMKFTLIPHRSLSTPKKRKLSTTEMEGKSASADQRLCYFKFVSDLKQCDVDPLKYTSAHKSVAAPNERRKSAENQMLDREFQLAKLRGLDYPGYFNSKRNLGNYLHLTASFMPGLDKCKQQKLPVTTFETKEFNTYLITGPPASNLLSIYNKARKLTKSTFANLGLSTSLYHTKNDQFTTMAITNHKQDIVAVAEYVLMRNYVWIESLCVSKEFQGLGIGHMMFNMLYHIGQLVKKELLLYSLNSAVPFYKSCGFTESKDFPIQCDNGLYLSQKTFPQ